ncbi:MAG: hypothetical protein AB7U79_08825 [Candidatus Izemoplasmatales bacterium]
MISNNDLVYFLDMARSERNISIQDFVEGITSRRNYSRFLSDEAELSFEMLGDFLTKLGIPLFEFGLYIYNKNFYNHINEIWFQEFIKVEKYDIAYNQYYPLIKDKSLGSVYAKKTIPIGVLLMKLHLNQIHKANAVHQIINILNLDSITNSSFLSADDLEAIFLYLRVANDSAKKQIADYLFKFIFDKKITILTTTVEITTILIYLSALKALTTKEKADQWDYLLIKKVFIEALKYHIKSKTLLYDILIFETMYLYYKKNQIENKYIKYYYIASIASSYENTYTEGKLIEIDQEDIDAYLSCVRDTDMMYESMYERIINDEQF